MARPRCVALIGPRAAGKTTLARCLAEQLGWRWQDCDALLAERAGTTVSDYLVQAGEPAFRALETEITTAALAAAQQTVLALGGGAPMSPAVAASLGAPGVFTVLVLAPVSVLIERQRRDPRPPLTPLPLREEVAALLDRRLPRFRSLAALEVDAAADPESCARTIVAALPRDR